MLDAAANHAGVIPRLSHLFLLPPALLATWWIHLHYGRSFGVVAPPLSDARSVGRWFWSLLGLTFSALALELATEPPVSPVGITMAIFVFAIVFLVAPRPARLAYGALGASMMAALLVSPLLLATGFEDRVFEAGGFVWNLFVGLTLTVGGIADHVILARALAPLEEGQHG